MRSHILALLSVLLLAACSTLPAQPPAQPAPDTPVTSPTEMPVLVDPPVTLPSDAPVQPTLPPVGGEEPMNPFDPQPGDAKLTRGGAQVESTALLLRESYPIQVSLELSGYLPNPCHQLRVVVNPPDVENRIIVEVYSVYDSSMFCTEVIKPFEASIALGSYSGASYTVYVNETLVGSFDS